ncbi:uncharacterized protein BJX67DRAFT_368384 [Aspergillus lucknowensis]|uniref:Biogenesis of lysosome-related organelles complex 1 subunit CNL1 n=1 Tax=Aspergillus lucknowensis TaxID=176173 RepID=A0ABR4L604_9EURO
MNRRTRTHPYVRPNNSPSRQRGLEKENPVVAQAGSSPLNRETLIEIADYPAAGSTASSDIQSASEMFSEFFPRILRAIDSEKRSAKAQVDTQASYISFLSRELEAQKAALKNLGEEFLDLRNVVDEQRKTIAALTDQVEHFGGHYKKLEKVLQVIMQLGERFRTLPLSQFFSYLAGMMGEPNRNHDLILP